MPHMRIQFSFVWTIDDAVHRTFVERLKTDAAAGVIDYGNKPRFALDYARGYAIRPSAEGLQA